MIEVNVVGVRGFRRSMTEKSHKKYRLVGLLFNWHSEAALGQKLGTSASERGFFLSSKRGCAHSVWADEGEGK